MALLQTTSHSAPKNSSCEWQFCKRHPGPKNSSCKWQFCNRHPSPKNSSCKWQFCRRQVILRQTAPESDSSTEDKSSCAKQLKMTVLQKTSRPAPKNSTWNWQSCRKQVILRQRAAPGNDNSAKDKSSGTKDQILQMTILQKTSHPAPKSSSCKWQLCKRQYYSTPKNTHTSKPASGNGILQKINHPAPKCSSCKWQFSGRDVTQCKWTRMTSPGENIPNRINPNLGGQI